MQEDGIDKEKCPGPDDQSGGQEPDQRWFAISFVPGVHPEITDTMAHANRKTGKTPWPPTRSKSLCPGIAKNPWTLRHSESSDPRPQ